MEKCLGEGKEMGCSTYIKRNSEVVIQGEWISSNSSASSSCGNFLEQSVDLC